MDEMDSMDAICHIQFVTEKRYDVMTKKKMKKKFYFSFENVKKMPKYFDFRIDVCMS